MRRLIFTSLMLEAQADEKRHILAAYSHFKAASFFAPIRLQIPNRDDHTTNAMMRWLVSRSLERGYAPSLLRLYEERLQYMSVLIVLNPQERK